MSASSIDITVQLIDPIQQISVDVLNTVQEVVIDRVSDEIRTIDLGAGFQNLVTSVNSRVGAVVLSYSTTLSSASPVSGVYSYTINHNLNSSNILAMVYNDSNQLVMTEISIINSNSISISSLVDLSNYKVVVQI